MKKLPIRSYVLTVFVAVLLACSSLAFATERAGGMAIGDLNLTEEQIVALGELINEFGESQFEIVMQIESKFAELKREIRKEGRFDTKSKEKKTVRKANKLVKEIISLEGQLLKKRVEYLLKAKNVLNEEQKMKMISALEFEDGFYEDELPEIFELDLLIIPLDLTKEQIKKILRYKTDMKIKALKIDLKILYQILDLQTEINKVEVDPKSIDKLILKITDLGTKLLENRVNGFLKSKDVLTVPQKKMLIQTFMM
jgi:Spy/CpxP family protein refolding chaperone